MRNFVPKVRMLGTAAMVSTITRAASMSRIVEAAAVVSAARRRAEVKKESGGGGCEIFTAVVAGRRFRMTGRPGRVRLCGPRRDPAERSLSRRQFFGRRA